MCGIKVYEKNRRAAWVDFATIKALGFPKKVASSTGVVAAFALMGVFHVVACHPVVLAEGLKRMGLFFVSNGILTVAEVAVWGWQISRGKGYMET